MGWCTSMIANYISSDEDYTFTRSSSLLLQMFELKQDSMRVHRCGDCMFAMNSLWILSCRMVWCVRSTIFRWHIMNDAASSNKWSLMFGDTTVVRLVEHTGVKLLQSPWFRCTYTCRRPDVYLSWNPGRTLSLKFAGTMMLVRHVGAGWNVRPQGLSWVHIRWISTAVFWSGAWV